MKLKKLDHFIEDNFLDFVTTWQGSKRPPSLVAAANLKIPSENGKEKNQTWLVCNSMFKIISIILAPKWNRCFFYTFWGMLTWLNQDDWMNMTEFGEHDQEIHTDEP